jgi:ribosomal protein S12 methylthiotransferase accessory factor YcaO
VTWELEQLRSAGMGEVIVVDLTRAELRIPVVRVVIPGMEGPMEKIRDYEYGARARHAMEKNRA